jgi:hypothetical protein
MDIVRRPQKHEVSGTETVSVFRRGEEGTLLDPFERPGSLTEVSLLQ